MNYIFRKNEAHFSELRFLAEAVSTDPTRWFMHGIHVEDDGIPYSDKVSREIKILTTTDGRRMHQFIVPKADLDIEAGDYSIIKKADIITLSTITYELDFPNWRRVMPEKTIGLYNNVDLNKHSSEKYKMEKLLYMLNRLDIVINHKWLSALDGYYWSISQNAKQNENNGRDRAVFFESYLGEADTWLKALIAPLDVRDVTERIIEAAENLLAKVTETIESEPEPTPEPQAAIEAEPEPEPPVGPEPQAAIEAEPDMEPEPEAEAPVGPEAEAPVGPEAEAPVGPEPEAEAEPVIEQARKARKLRQSSKAVADCVWIPNRLGTKQVMRCRF